ncbi:MAG: adventurous gliding motility protein [Pseudomonadota bacterium]|jgi:biopolymer transport protein TolQ
MENSVHVNTSAFDAIMQASLLVQLTLLMLISLSVLCWAVAYLKHRQFNVLKAANEPFLVKFENSNSLDHIFENLDRFPGSSLARVFAAGYSEMKRLAESPHGEKKQGTLLQLTGIDNLERTVRKAIDLEVAKMESKTSWLATTGSTGPFIGLFGTVWGIMSSFQKIGQMGSATLAVVAPGISEALVATAIGLAAAIPAVMLYNHFISEIKKQELVLNNFAADFLNVAKRNFFRE